MKTKRVFFAIVYFIVSMFIFAFILKLITKIFGVYPMLAFFACYAIVSWFLFGKKLIKDRRIKKQEKLLK